MIMSKGNEMKVYIVQDSAILADWPMIYGVYATRELAKKREKELIDKGDIYGGKYPEILEEEVITE